MTQKFSILGAYKAKQATPAPIQKESLDANTSESISIPITSAGDVSGNADSSGIQNESIVVEAAAQDKTTRTSLLGKRIQSGATGAAVQSGSDSKANANVAGSGSPGTSLAAKPSLLAGVAKAAQRKEALSQDHSYLFAEMPEDYKELVDRFDAMLVRDNGIDFVNLDLARAYVKKIMIMLKEQPELDGLTQDRDVRNIIMFIRSLKESAVEQVAEKKVKGEKRKATAAAKKVNRFGNFDAIDFNSMPDTLDAFADMKDIEL